MYRCPRDGEKLKWKQFLTTGRWHCKKCDGTLAFKKHLKKLNIFHEFEHSLGRSNDNEESIDCPICMNDMAKLRVTVGRRSCVIDVCHDCLAYWFDPQELKLVEEPSIQRKYNKYTDSEAGKGMNLSFDEFFEVKDYSKYIFQFKIAFIVFNIFLVLSFFEIDGNLDVIGRLSAFPRRFDPLGFALLGTLFSILYGFNSERYLWVVFPGVFCTLASVLIYFSLH